MAYGKGKDRKAHLYRASPLVRVPDAVPLVQRNGLLRRDDRRAASPDLGAAKQNRLSELRCRSLILMRTMAEAALDRDPLLKRQSAERLDAVLLAVQTADATLSSVYREKCRLAVKAALEEHSKRFLGRLLGRLTHLADRTDEQTLAWRHAKACRTARRKGLPAPEAPAPWRNVPETIAKSVTETDLAAVAAAFANRTWADALSLARTVVHGAADESVSGGLTEAQIAIVRAVHADLLSRHEAPGFGGEDAVVQFPIDARFLPSVDKHLPQTLDDEAAVLVDKKNARFRFFLALTAPEPEQGGAKGTRLILPLALSSRLLKRVLDKDARVGSLTLEVGNGTWGVRAVVAKRKPPTKELASIKHLVSRDYGYANTVTLSVVKLERELDAKVLEAIRALDKEQARDYLASHVHDPADATVVKRLRYSGGKFLARLNEQAKRIDALRSEIDHHYNRIEALVYSLKGHLGLGPDDLVPDADHLIPLDPFARKLQAKLFDRLKHVAELKRRRRAVYRSIAALKRCWFGHLSNVELDLCRTLDAALVREDLTVMAPEKETPEYKGRTFAKLINNGSKGQYIKRASMKLAWDGVPELVVPSWYTSSACVRHSLVDTGMRKRQDLFVCPCCAAEGRADARRHADENAADTIGLYPVLRPAGKTNGLLQAA